VTTRPALIVSGFLYVILAIYLLFYGRSMAAFAFAKWKFRNLPEIWIVPKPLLHNAASYSSGSKLAYFGYEFESPVSEVKEERRVESAVVLSFSDCAGMTIFEPQPSGDLIRGMQEEASKKGRDIKGVFGEEATRSNYALRSKILKATPRDVRLFSSPREIIGNTMPLSIKSVELQRFKNGLYSFETPWMRGFQEGDLNRDRGVVIDAFDKQDRQLMLILGAKPGKACSSQPDLNRIVFSLKPIEPS
jgi:hypothetical protein